MSRLDFSVTAVDDLRGILSYISRDKPKAAVEFVAFIKDKCSLLAQFPEMGASREELAASMRAFPIGSYVIYYRTTGDGVRIDRVLHAARDVDVLL